MNLEAELHLKVGRKELVLSPQEARELRDLLCELVGPRESVRWYPSYPWYTTTTTPFITTCGSSGTASWTNANASAVEIDGISTTTAYITLDA